LTPARAVASLRSVGRKGAAARMGVDRPPLKGCLMHQSLAQTASVVRLISELGR
jgi:hypothetical protein